MALDCGGQLKAGRRISENIQKAKYRISIDHHESHEEFAQITLLEDKASSTAQIVYKVLKEFDSSLIDKDIAAHIYWDYNRLRKLFFFQYKQGDASYRIRTLKLWHSRWRYLQKGYERYLNQSFRIKGKGAFTSKILSRP